MKPDISNRRDIEKLVHLFYERLRKDEKLNFFFSEVVSIDWQKHEQKMCAFWENILFYTGEYEGNPLITHRKLNEKHPTSAQHFKRWFYHFNQTIDALFEGRNVQRMKDHARRIADIMQQKIK